MQNEIDSASEEERDVRMEKIIQKHNLMAQRETDTVSISQIAQVNEILQYLNLSFSCTVLMWFC